MPVDNSQLTQEEVDFLGQATLSRRIANRGDVVALDRIESGVFQYALSKAKSFGNPVQGGFRFYVKGNRNQRIQWWQGADILTFDNQSTLSDMVFDVGKGHMGFELLYDTIERNGIRIKYGAKGVRNGGADESVVERTQNIIEQTFDDVEYAWMNDVRMRFMTDNADEPRCFTGRAGLIDPTANTTGLIGKRPRSNRLFQHQLVTGVTKDTLMLAFFKLIRSCNRRAGTSKIDYITCGDEVYNTLVDLFVGSSTVAGKFDFRAAQDKAMKKGEKYNISMPQDCFQYEDTLIVNDPVYQLLSQAYPSANPSWEKRMEFWNFSHFGVVPVVTEMDVPHSMPHNQRVMRQSKHGEWAVWCDQPSTQGVLILA